MLDTTSASCILLPRSSRQYRLDPRVHYLCCAPPQANMHGDEPTGRQLTLALAEWLCGSRGSDPRAARLLDEAILYLLPTMNPDGFASRRRENRSAGWGLD